MSFVEEIKDAAKQRRARIGIGLIKNNEIIENSLKEASQIVDVVVVGPQKVGDHEWHESPDNKAEKLFELLKEGKIDGVLRGNYDALVAYEGYRNVFDFKDPFANVVLAVIKDGIFSINENKEGVFAVVGASPSNDRTTWQRIQAVEYGIKVIKDLGIEPKIGILSAGKPTDISEEIPEIDHTLLEAEFIKNWFSEKGYFAKHYNHQLEYAINESNIILSQNGIAGNLLSRFFLFFGRADYIGSVIANLDNVFINVPEALQDYNMPLIFAAAMANKKINSSKNS